MNKEQNDSLIEILSSFDKSPKNTFYERRASSKFLWDFFMKILFEIGTNYFGLYPESLKISSLKTRWNKIKRLLDDKNIEKWNGTINKINTIREKVEHNDFFAPDIEDFTCIRSQAIEFKKWIHKVADEFNKENKKTLLIDATCPICKEKLSMVIDYLTKKDDKFPYAVIIRVQCKKCYYLVDSNVLSLKE